MEINVKALMEHVEYQITAMYMYEREGIISTKQSERAITKLAQIKRIHTKAIKMRGERFITK